MSVTAQAPGKLFLIGEYAITLPYQSAIAFAVDKFVTVTAEKINPSEIQIHSNQLGKQIVTFEDLQQVITADNWQLVKKAIQTFYRYHFENSDQYQGIKITISSNLTASNGNKLGLGSSAAVVMAIIKALNKLFNLRMAKLKQFKLGAITMLSLPTFAKGSMADLAVATYGGMIFYRKFDESIIRDELANEVSYNDILQKDWPGLEIGQLNWPIDWHIAIGWTGEPADTQKILGQVKTTAEIAALKQQLALATQPLIKSFVLGVAQQDYNLVKKSILDNATYLSKYTDQVGINYLTSRLRTAITIADTLNIPAKASGAGAGDNVVAVTTNVDDETALQQAWQAAGIIPLLFHIAILGE